ncbi:MAG TPA: aminopeptidase P family protein, partial [Candidatus Coatesbacteria bacterium]|nr:aminopeptidase P family protein [Candidatus Coatesbacteria bacterium]
MREELDRLMEERGIDWLFIVGGNGDNPAMHYFIGDAPIGECSVWKPKGGKAYLFTGPFEREEAKKLPFIAVDTSKYNYHELVEKEPDPLKRSVEFFRRMMTDVGVQGRVSLCGKGNLGAGYAFYQALDGAVPGVRIEPEFDNDVIITARETKDAEEIARIRRVGEKSCQVFAQVRKLLGSAEERGGELYISDEPLTVGRVKRFITLELFKRGLMEDVGTIFAPGDEGGYPHSHGTDSRRLRVGEPVVFDMFPRELGHGYYFDMTRTWCVGELHPEAQRDYELVKEVQAEVERSIEVGGRAYSCHKHAAELIARAGHPTIISDPETNTGFCHGLGHGVGLDIHEKPRLGGTEKNPDLLLPGSVFTNEPGVYYP